MYSGLDLDFYGYDLYSDGTVTNPVDLLKIIENKIVVLTGQSGAGKSTLRNKIDPSLELKTDRIEELINGIRDDLDLLMKEYRKTH